MAIPSLVTDAQVLATGEDSGLQNENVTYDSGVLGTNRCLVGLIAAEAVTGATATLDGVSVEIGATRLADNNVLVPFTLKNPSTGSNTLAITFDGDPNDWAVICATYEFVNQTTHLVSLGVGNAGSATGEDDIGIYPDAVGNLLVTCGLIDGGGTVAGMDGLSSYTPIAEDKRGNNEARGFVSGLYTLATDSTSEHLVGINAIYNSDWAWQAFELVGDTNDGGGGDPVPEQFSYTASHTLTSTDFAAGWSFYKTDSDGSSNREDATVITAVTNADTDEILLNVTFPTGKPTGAEKLFSSYDATVGDITEATTGGALVSFSDVEGSVC
jgi:hypothetical protein